MAKLASLCGLGLELHRVEFSWNYDNHRLHIKLWSLPFENFDELKKIINTSEKKKNNENLREERSYCNLKHLLLRNGNYAG
jgi:hypothetical protein